MMRDLADGGHGRHQAKALEHADGQQRPETVAQREKQWHKGGGQPGEHAKGGKDQAKAEHGNQGRHGSDGEDAADGGAGN